MINCFGGRSFYWQSFELSCFSVCNTLQFLVGGDKDDQLIVCGLFSITEDGFGATPRQQRGKKESKSKGYDLLR